MAGIKNLYLLAGNPRGKGEITHSVLEKALSETGVDKPSVAYIGTASGDSRIFMQFIARSLKKAGAGEVSMCPMVGKRADLALAEQRLRECDAVYVSGGEVEDGIVGIPDNIKSLLTELREEGKVFIGLSAGTIMLGKAWPHWDDEDNDFDNARLFDCLGFVKTIFDTHAEDEGFVELKKAVELSDNGFVGYGIPSDCAIIVHPDGSFEKIGKVLTCTNQDGHAILK
jgi:peptidase E